MALLVDPNQADVVALQALLSLRARQQPEAPAKDLVSPAANRVAARSMLLEAQRADRHYVRLLHLAASTSESEVEIGIGLLLEQRVVPTFDAVRGLLRPPAVQRVPELRAPVLDLSVYDRLRGRELAHA